MQTQGSMVRVKRSLHFDGKFIYYYDYVRKHHVLWSLILHDKLAIYQVNSSVCCIERFAVLTVKSRSICEYSGIYKFILHDKLVVIKHNVKNVIYMVNLCKSFFIEVH
jgi:hypothetical protein